MIIRQKIIARKYAQAFLNLYFDALTQLHIDAVIDLHKFLLENKGILCYLSLPGLTEQAWTDFSTRLYARFELPVQLGRLIQVLLERRSIALLPLVLNSLLQDFWQRRHVLHFNITSSHVLEAEEQASVIKFLAEKTGAAEVKAKFSIDESLICGINMQSNSYKFEHSVAQELKKIKESLLQRVQL